MEKLDKFNYLIYFIIMDKLLIFDVDGTICESSQNIELNVKELIQSLKNKYDLAICGGGKLEKILIQLGDNNKFDYYFSECGCVYHDSNLKLIHKKDIRQHKLYNKINILIKLCLLFLSNVDYTLTGNFIDLRNGIIYISLIGLTANYNERMYFIELDKKNNYKHKLLNLLKEKAIELNINDELFIGYGGSVGISIYPIEYDKTQILEHLQYKYKEIHYFGDKYLSDGNDYNIINNKNIIGHKIDNIDDTIKHLNELKN